MTEKKEKSTAIELECPGCAEINLIDPQRSVLCKKCTKPITGKRYKITSLGVLPFIFGAVGYGLVDRQILAEERYPVKYEYALISACINSHQTSLPRQTYKTKQNACVCAVEETIKDITYADFKEDQKVFSNQLGMNLPGCY